MIQQFEKYAVTASDRLALQAAKQAVGKPTPQYEAIPGKYVDDGWKYVKLGTLNENDPDAVTLYKKV
jgi:hypothetical protein